MMAMRRPRTSSSSSAAVSFCTNVTAAAVTLFAAASLVVLVGDAFLIVDGADKIVEQCAHSKDRYLGFFSHIKA